MGFWAGHLPASVAIDGSCFSQLPPPPDACPVRIFCACSWKPLRARLHAMRACDTPADLSGARLISYLGLLPRLRSNASPSSESEPLMSNACAVTRRAVLAVEVLLVQHPADALDGAALVLALDIGGVDRLAGVLHDDITQHLHGAGLGIDLDIADVGGKARPRTLGVDLVVAR